MQPSSIILLEEHLGSHRITVVVCMPLVLQRLVSSTTPLAFLLLLNQALNFLGTIPFASTAFSAYTYILYRVL